MFNYFSVANIISSIFCFAIGVFTLLKNSKANINKIFFIQAASSSIWQLGTAMVLLSQDPAGVDFWARFAYFGAIFIPVATFHLAVEFLQSKILKKFVVLGYLLGLFVFLPLSRTRYFIDGSYNYYWGPWFKAGIVHPIFLIFFVIFMLAGFVCLYISFKKKDVKVEKIRLIYLFTAYVIAYTGVVDFLPDYGIEIYPFGSVSVFIYILVVSYAIIRHQLMDIELVIKRTLVFAGLFSFIFGVLAATIMFLSTFIISFDKDHLYLFIGISAVIIIFLHQPVYNFLVNVTNRYLFQKKYDPKKILKEFSNEVLTILNLDRLCKATIDTLVKNLYLTNCAVLLKATDETGYELYDSLGIDDRTVYFANDSNIIRRLKVTQSPILYQSYDKKLQSSDEIKEDMDKMKSYVCMPLVIHDQLVGILSLGMKKSDQVYAVEDIDILTTLVRALSIAISNAKLFALAAQYEKLAAIGTLASGINHEVCNPLNNISTNMQIFISNLHRDAYKDKTQDELLKIAEDIMQDSIKEIHKVAGITGRLSSFAKPSRITTSRPIDITQSLEDALGVVGHKLELDKIKIVKNIPRDLPKIIVDEYQMQEIFFNLIRNAAQAIKEKGVITIDAKEDKDKIKVEISDTGCGIPEDKLNKIFEPFYTTKADGSGYGLSIVREIVWRNKGNITVKSKVDEGTTFYLDFQKA